VNFYNTLFVHNNDATMRMGAIEISFIGPAAPAGADLIVVEEDTCGLLNAPADIRDPNEHPIRLYTALHNFIPFEPGSVRMHANVLEAVVVDIEAQPPCRPEWIKLALQKIFAHIEQHRLHSIELPLLGTRYGKLDIETSIRLIREALLQYPQTPLHKIQLRMDSADIAAAQRILERS
jgi:hypothetical protein